MAYKYNVAGAPLGWRHWWITFVTSLGQFVGTVVATIAGIIIPMLAIVKHSELNSWVQGLIGAADLIGIMIGSLLFGNLTDRFGYLKFFRICPLIILGGALVAIFVPNVWVLIGALFFVGIGIGGEYSLDSDYVSVLMPDRWKTIMLGIVKAGSSLGNIIAAALGFVLIMSWKEAAKWPDLMWIVAVTGALMFVTRIYFFESPKWLSEHGRIQEAQKAVTEFLGSDVEMMPVAPSKSASSVAAPSKSGSASKSNSEDLSLWGFCKKYWNRVVLSGVPWACEGLGVYGIGVFIPILVMALGIEHQEPGLLPIFHVAESVKTTLWISLIMLPGFLLGIWITSKKTDKARLQALTFWACGISLLVLLFAYQFHWAKWISLISFMAFELFLNLGPHLVTYLLPPDIYPVEIRGQGTGIAAALGKLGAVLGVFLIPVLLKLGGSVLVLGVSAAVMAIGAIVTSVYGRRVYGKAAAK